MSPLYHIKRVYEPRTRGDGRRFLVERLWPRGLKKEALHADAWLKDVAPSTELRQWFAHRVERWPAFQVRYKKELDGNPGAWAPLVEASRAGPVTLLYSARDQQHNAAVVLGQYLSQHSRSGRARASKARRASPRKH
jgi:uncharacterized protein YeaO (DUF488 family)